MQRKNESMYKKIIINRQKKIVNLRVFYFDRIIYKDKKKSIGNYYI